MENFKQKLVKVKAVILDVDGVLTDGSVILMSDGEQLRTMNIKDGYALQLAVKKGLHVAIISGGRSELVRKRLHGLGVTDVYLGCADKLDAYNELLSVYGIDHDEVMYMGDDMPDYDVMRRVGVPVCPADAAPEIKNLCLYVSNIPGGRGAVRDVLEQLLKVQKKWYDNEGFIW
jgi:3-deoxy-D-manno-octulosonate 8-phosphate phosphatase (KDO 8-P phosphatase)